MRSSLGGKAFSCSQTLQPNTLYWGTSSGPSSQAAAGQLGYPVVQHGLWLQQHLLPQGLGLGSGSATGDTGLTLPLPGWHPRAERRTSPLLRSSCAHQPPNHCASDLAPETWGKKMKATSHLQQSALDDTCWDIFRNLTPSIYYFWIFPHPQIHHDKVVDVSVKFSVNSSESA